MSFSTNVKEELNSIHIKSNCCKKAYLFGVSLCAERENDNINITLSDRMTADQTCSFLHSIYKIEPQKKEIRRGCYSAVSLEFSSHRIAEFLDFTERYETGADISKFFSCNTCKQTFLRALFCARGSVSDPQKSFSLEIIVGDEKKAALVSDLIGQTSMTVPGITKRRGGYGIFYRNELSIEDFLSSCGANHALFTFFDAHVEKNIRNLENRATNCVARNISKSVDAIAKQVLAIEKLKECGILDEMPSDLQKTAELRLEYPEATLSDLASLHKPEISKSGVNHRISKLIDEAKKLKLI